MIDRFGPLPEPTANLLKLIEIKHQAIEANIAKIDVGAKGTLVSFHKDDFPDLDGPDRLCRAAGGHGQAAPRHEAGHQPRLGNAAGAAQRGAAIVEGAGEGGGMKTLARAIGIHGLSAIGARLRFDFIIDIFEIEM